MSTIPTKASSEESDDGLGPLPLAHRVSAQVLGWGAAVSQHRRSSAEEHSVLPVKVEF